MAAFRRILFWTHLLCGTIAGLVILTMSVTGVLLTFERQLNAWSRTRELPPRPSSSEPALPLSQLLARLDANGLPEAVAVTVNSSRPHLAEVELPKRRTVFVDRASGQLIAESRSTLAPFFSTVVGIHRYLGTAGDARKIGKSITGASNLAFLFLVLSGFYLWWPKTWNRTQFRNILLFRGSLAGKARDFNWHNVIGIWSFVPLVIIVASGVVISYAWAGDLVYRMAGEAPPVAAPAPPPIADTASAQPVNAASLDARWQQAEQQVSGWKTLTMRTPGATSRQVSFTIDNGDGGQPQARALASYDLASGERQSWQPFSSFTAGRKARLFLRFAHTGEFFGLPGQTIAGLVSAGAAFLVWTGIALAWRRFRNWRKSSVDRNLNRAAA